MLDLHVKNIRHLRWPLNVGSVKILLTKRSRSKVVECSRTYVLGLNVRIKSMDHVLRSFPVVMFVMDSEGSSSAYLAYIQIVLHRMED